MCGICGFTYKRSDREYNGILDAMKDALQHRGPDAEGGFIGDFASVGMRRLSVIDLSTGQQPVFNENKSLAVVFNGEIYNYRELRQELEAKGHQFRTKSDTEVLVHLYEENGVDMLKSLNGMFAFAILDIAKREIFFARDHFGIKPL